MQRLVRARRQRERIVQTGFDAFSRGTFGNGGENLYISRSGTIQTINQRDINRDGHNDVLLSNDHDLDETVDAFVYWNRGKGFKSFMPELWQRGPDAGEVGWVRRSTLLLAAKRHGSFGTRGTRWIQCHVLFTSPDAAARPSLAEVAFESR